MKLTAKDQAFLYYARRNRRSRAIVQALPAWAKDTPVEAGSYVQSNGNAYVAHGSGTMTTGTTPPTAYGQQSDGAVTWQFSDTIFTAAPPTPSSGGGGGGGGGPPVAFQIDGTPVTAVGNGSIASLTLPAITTTVINDIAMIVLSTGNSADTVAGVTGGGGVWAKKDANPWDGGGISNTGDLEIWWAKISTIQASMVIEATFTAPVSAVSALGFAVSGANITTPWDANASLPAPGQGDYAATAGPVSTTAANTMLLALLGTQGSPHLGDITGGWANLGGAHDVSDASGISVAYLIVSAAQIGVSEAFPDTLRWGTMVEALVKAA